MTVSGPRAWIWSSSSPCFEYRERAERVAVVALASRDEVAPLRLPDLHEILPRHLEGRLDRLRAAGDEIDMAHAGRRVGDEIGAQALGRFRGEEARMGVGQPVELGMHGREHVRMRVPEAGHGGAARGIDVVPPLAVADCHPGPAHRHGIIEPDRAVENMGVHRNILGQNRRGPATGPLGAA
jgi:hypothetical protein